MNRHDHGRSNGIKGPLGLVAALLFMCCSLHAGPREAQWKAVEDAIKKGLPKTAVTNLEPIIQGALKDKAYAEAVKAIGEKIALEGNIQGNKPEEKITRLQDEIAKAPMEMVPLMDTLLAEWYWQYFLQNRWRFMQRATTAERPGKDFTTWDLPRLFAEIDKQFQKALAAEKILKATPIAAWNDLLNKGTMSDQYRPTLYDFIAHEALAFYTSGEQAAAKPENAFELRADSPIFDSTDKFIAWKPETTDTESPTLKAIHLYQDLLRFHKADTEPQFALANADLERLAWGANAAFGEDLDTRYRAALEGFIRTYADFEISALALQHEALLLQRQGDLVEAHKLAKRGAETFPKSPGGKLCHNLLVEIEARSVSITTEHVWNCGAGISPSGPCPVINLQYRNIETVYFRAIPVDWETFLQKRHNRPENLSIEERREVLARPPALEWSAQLPPTSDYKEQSFEVGVPDTLKPGFYFIATSHDPKFGERENIVSMASVWVTGLALVTRVHDGKMEGFVLQANSGEPISGAQISVWHLDQVGNRVTDPALTTDENGFFAMQPEQNRGYLFRASHDGQAVSTQGDLWNYWGMREDRRPTAQTVFFTDRAIYRPGQTIQYKGICLWVDQKKDNYEVLKGEAVTVVFMDVNGKEIAREKKRANDYGSFAGSFTAPRDRLMGQMSLLIEGRAEGSAYFRVEEYKRPKFEVTLDAPKTAAKLNEKVSLTGHALAFTGAAVDGALVKYRIVRQVRMPWWWSWWGGWSGNENQEIAHGTLKAGNDGNFTIEFLAKPDPKIAATNEPTFNFQITADVTDSAGETRSADRSIRVGYTALEAMMNADGWQTDDKPVELKLETKTLDGEPQAAEGSVKIYALEAPDKVHRAFLSGAEPWRYRGQFGGDVAGQGPGSDLSNPNNWPLGKIIEENGFTTGSNGMANLSFKLAVGAYRAVLTTQDRFGKKVTSRLPIQVLQPAASSLAIKIPNLFTAPEWKLQPGEEFMALWGTGYDAGRAFIEIEHNNKIVQRFWTGAGRTQQQIKLAVTEAMRGGFYVHLTYVRDNRAYLDSRRVDVPWKNKDLDIKWEHFVSKLQPNQKETWTAVISRNLTNYSRLFAPSNPPPVEKVVAEMVATLYDESLDAFAPLNWPQRFSVFREDYSNLQPQFANALMGFQPVFGNWSRPYEPVVITYRAFPADLTANLWGYGYFQRRRIERYLGQNRNDISEADSLETAKVPASAPALAGVATMPAERAAGKLVFYAGSEMKDKALDEPAGVGGALPPSGGPKIDLSGVTARKNLNETAFFYPQLMSDSNGVVRMTFTMPEALTKWRFLGFAHDRSLRSGFLDGHAVTAKDLMVQPNPPRFLREGDTIEFTVKVSNQTDKPQRGKVQLTFNLAQNNQPADKLLDNSKPERDFEVPAKESRSYSWRIHVPDGCGFLSYKTVGASATVSDGEEGYIPVLSRRILVIESLPLPIRGPATKKFEFTKLLKSGSSKTLQSQSLVVEMVSHPAWYAVLALPYLIEYPYECSEQTFNRLYANALARNIANSDPKIRRIFDQWKNTPALESPLQKNQDLKSVMIEETPWLQQAMSESQARKNVGILFDENRLNYETEATLRKLTDLQLSDRRWPWFPGGMANDYITLYITTGFGRLRHLGVDMDVQPAIRSLQRLDAWMSEEYNRIQTLPEPEKYVPNSIDAFYLYGRSFFLKDMPIAPQNKKAVEFFLNQSRKYWLKTDCRQTQGHLAIALHRFSAFNALADSTPKDIMKSLKERSVTNEEMGMFWRDTELSWWWYRAPIETQALMIEAFDEVMNDQPAVEECRVWLLKQKQTQDWKTTKATSDAVYALLLRGKNLLSSDALVQVKLDGVDVTPPVGGGPQKSNTQPSSPAVEPGTGFYAYRFAPTDIKPKLGEITVRKVDEGVAWGSVNWQYLEDMSKVTPYEGTPLKLKKSLFTKVNTAKGRVLEGVKGPLSVGDELVVRIELRVDRDMEYVHLEDQRGSGTEPVNVISRYKYQDGLRYYESTRDVASHFFIDYLPKGVYVFEYSTRVQLRGQYQTGIAAIQCMYAPEFNSHSESLPLTVK